MSIDLTALLPLLIVASGPLLIMVLLAVKRNHRIVASISLLLMAAAFFALFRTLTYTPFWIDPLFIFDGYAVFFMGLIFAASFVIISLSFGYMNKFSVQSEEYYILIFLATLGTAILVVSQHFVSLFLGLEILSVSLYVLISYRREEILSLEAGVKYLILAALSSAFLLFGMALVYAETGTMNIFEIAAMIEGFRWTNLILLAGFSLLLTGFGFKLAVVPFHMWTPDVYQGAPAPVTAFIATVSKGGMFALLFRFFLVVDIYQNNSLLLIFSIIAVASMFIGNILALLQNNLKRLLAYSSIAHLGYLLVAFLAGGTLGIQGASFYLVAYFITTLGAFGIITVMTSREGELTNLDDYRGLYWRKPWLSVTLSAMLFSLAGIPLTAGFIGKFYIIAAGVESALWTLLIILVVNSAIGLYYYLRVIVAMFSSQAEQEIALEKPYVSFGSSIVLAVLTLLLIWFGIYPEDILVLIRKLVSTLV